MADLSQEERVELDYIFGHEGSSNGTPRIIDLCFTAFMRGKEALADGTPTDWMNDTLPNIKAGIDHLKSRLLASARVDEQAPLEAVDAFRGALTGAADAINEYHRYQHGGDGRNGGSYDGKPERANLWRAGAKAREVLLTYQKTLALSSEPIQAGWRERAAGAAWEASRQAALADGEDDPGPWPPTAGRYDWMEDDSQTAREKQLREVDAILSQLPSGGGAPDGWRLVPKKALPKQLEDAAFNLSAEIGPEAALALGPHIEAAYELLVAAAPRPPTGRVDADAPHQAREEADQ